MTKPTFSVNFVGTGIAPCVVEFTDTYQAPSEKIWRFDFGDGRMYELDQGESIVRHEYLKAGTFQVKAIAVDMKTMSDPVTVQIHENVGPVDKESFWTRFWKWLLGLFE